MPRRPTGSVPALVHHKASNRARVRINGRDFWLGKWGSPAATMAYDRLIAEYLATRRILPPVLLPVLPPVASPAGPKFPLATRPSVPHRPAGWATLYAFSLYTYAGFATLLPERAVEFGTDEGWFGVGDFLAHFPRHDVPSA